MTGSRDLETVIEKRVERIAMLHPNHQLGALGREILAEIIALRQEMSSLREAVEQSNKSTKDGDVSV